MREGVQVRAGLPRLLRACVWRQCASLPPLERPSDLCWSVNGRCACLLASSASCCPQEFQEYSEESETLEPVRRDPALADNALLPGGCPAVAASSAAADETLLLRRGAECLPGMRLAAPPL